VKGEVFRVKGEVFRVKGEGWRAKGSNFRVQGSGSMIQESTRTLCLEDGKTSYVKAAREKYPWNSKHRCQGKP
jgi:hypothetical protein